MIKVGKSLGATGPTGPVPISSGAVGFVTPTPVISTSVGISDLGNRRSVKSDASLISMPPSTRSLKYCSAGLTGGGATGSTTGVSTGSVVGRPGVVMILGS